MLDVVAWCAWLLAVLGRTEQTKQVSRPSSPRSGRFGVFLASCDGVCIVCPGGRRSGRDII